MHIEFKTILINDSMNSTNNDIISSLDKNITVKVKINDYILKKMVKEGIIKIVESDKKEISLKSIQECKYYQVYIKALGACKLEVEIPILLGILLVIQDEYRASNKLNTFAEYFNNIKEGQYLYSISMDYNIQLCKYDADFEKIMNCKDKIYCASLEEADYIVHKAKSLEKQYDFSKIKQ